jgi:SAM-dependent methyltransferase
MSQEKDEYIFTRSSWMESARLSYQHTAYSDLYGGPLDGKIVSQLKLSEHPPNGSRLQILDLACGNAIWTMDVATRYPYAQVTGLDISTDAFPAEEIRPKNVSLAVMDALGEIPAEYVGKFDVVHIRLLMSVLLKPGAIDVAIRNIVKLIKPGGYLHWQDITYPMSSPVNLSTEPPSFEGFTAMQVAMEEETKFLSKFEWSKRLTEMVAAQPDMKDVVGEEMPIKKHLLRKFTELLQWSWEDGIPKLFSMLGSEEKVERMMAALEKDKKGVQEGKLWMYRGVQIIGRKV